MPPSANDSPMTNWGGNVTYCAKQIHYPETAEEVARIVAGSGKVKALGTRHSFNKIADTDGDLICVAKMNQVICLDKSAMTVTVEPGITYGALGAFLHQHGYALENLPSLPHVCVGGAVQTGTHGSGTANLSTAVVAIQMATADGQLREFSYEHNGESFNGMVVSLGLLGVVTRLTLKIQKTFLIQQEVYEFVPLEDLLEHYNEVVASAYRVSLFTDWQSDRVNEVWFKRLVTEIPLRPLLFDFLNGRRAKTKLHPIASVPADFCTDQNTPGPWHERLPHFRPDHEPSSAGHELQNEYFIARKDAPTAIRAIQSIGRQLRDCLMISEIRTIEADTLWLSPCYQRPSIGIHFTWQPNEAEVLQLIEKVIEPTLSPFDPRPHWGKLFLISPSAVTLRVLMMKQFSDLQIKHGREKFLNKYAERFLTPRHQR